MRHYAYYDAVGVVRYMTTLQDDTEATEISGATPVELDAPLSTAPDGLQYRMVNGVIGTHAIQVSVDERRTEKLASFKDLRDAAIYGGLTWDGSVFDTDERSQTVLLGLYVSAQAAGFQPKAWRLADNSWRVLSAQDSAGVWGALESHIEQQFTRFAQCEAQLNAASTAAQLENVTWPP